MPISFNPFHEWLGLRANLTNPHHYQLLGVSPKDDAAAIKKAAQAKLGLLKQAQPGSLTPDQHKSLIEKVKNRIIVAHQTLSVPEKKTGYDKKLKELIEKSKTTAATSEKPQPSTPAATGAAAPVQPHPADKPFVSESPLTPNEPIVQQPAPVQQPTALPPASTAPVVPPIVEQPVVDKIAIQTKQNKRKPVIGLPASDFSPPGTEVPGNPAPVENVIGPPEIPALPVSSVPDVSGTNETVIPMAVPLSPNPNGDANPSIQQVAAAAPRIGEASPDINQPQPNIVSPTTNELSPIRTGLENVSKRKPLIKKRTSWKGPIIALILCLAGMGGLVYIVMNMDAITGRGIADVGPDTPDRTSTQADNDDEAPEDPLSKPKPPNVVPEDVPNTIPDGTTNTIVDDPFKETTGNRTTTSRPKKQLTIDSTQRILLRQAMDRARWAMMRRDKGTTIMATRAAKNLFPTLNDDEELSPADQELFELVESTEQVMNYLDGFWRQVVTSAESMSGAEQFQIGETFLGFVESTTGQVVLRNAGVNVVYTYEFMPAGIAKAIAEAGAKDDVPTYRMQLASFYAVHSPLDSTYGEKAKSFARLAANEGHDPSPIVKYVETSINSFGLPENKIDWPTPNEFDSAVKTGKTRLGLPETDGLDSVNATRAINDAMHFLAVEDGKENKQAALAVAWEVALRSGQMQLAEDVIREAKFWANIDEDSLLIQALETISGHYNHDVQSARMLIEAAIPRLKTADLEELPFKRIYRSAVKFADSFNQVDLQRRLMQLSD